MAELLPYLDLVPSANRQKPKFIASLGAALEPLLAVMVTLERMPGAFDIDDAVGRQLDAVGVRVGLSRRLATPIEGVYFAFDVDGVGFDEGVWLGPNDPVDGLVSLDDETYRLMLKIKVAANRWGGSLEQAQSILAAIAGDGTHLFVQDNFDMSMTVGISGKIPSKLFIALIRQIMRFVRPGAVDISLVVVTSLSGASIFGLDTDNDFIGGFDVGAWAKLY